MHFIVDRCVHSGRTPFIFQQEPDQNKLKTNLKSNSVTSHKDCRPVGLTFAAAAILLAGAATSEAALVFDNISNYENAAPGAAIAATGSTPNTFMGDAYTLAAGTTDITGFDIFPVNLTGTAYSGLKINIFVWGTVNTGTVSATTPAFGDLLGSYTLTTATAAGSFPSGYYFSFEGSSPGGTAPGVTLGTPLAIPSTTIGVTFNYQGTTDGVTYTSANSLSSLLTYGTAPSVGSMPLGGATGGYYRNANSEVNGNFTSGLRTLTGDAGVQGVALRVYGDITGVPEPTSAALIGLGTAALLIFRRRK
jgi:hypothetical protein